MKKSLISAIKKLLAKLGAEEIEGNNLVEVIDSGADAIEGSGGSGGNAFVVHEDSKGTLDKTMGEIQAAFLRNDKIELQGNNGGGVMHSIAVRLHEIHYDGRSGMYDSLVSFAMADTIVSYSVSEASEAAALAAYPKAS